MHISGCPDQRAKPEEALEAFLADLQYGRAESAWAALSESSRKALIERHRASADVGGAMEETPGRMLFSDLGIVVMAPPESIVVVSPLGDQVTLRVAVAGGQSAEIHMVREGASWKVDLMKSLKEAPPLAETSTGT